MSVSVAKPVVAASLVASTIAYIGYLWYKQRAEEGRDQEDLEDQETSAPATHTELHLEQVQQRLHCIQRSRLETLVEESVSGEQQTEADTKDETVTDCEQDRTKTDPSEEITETTQSVEDIESSETGENCKMAVEETPLASVPDVVSALNDPLCGETDSYSSSPVKSESAQSKSSCEWSDLIEQDMKEMQEFQLDSRELTCKLSGLELAGSGRSNDR